MSSDAAPKTPRARRGDEGRRRLLDVAIESFSRHGFRGTSIDRIARAAGVTKGAIYYHFRDKEDLLFGAIDERIESFESRVIREAKRLRDPLATLRAIVETCAEQARKSNQRRFILTLMVETIGAHPELSNRFRAMMRRFREFVAHTVRLGQERGTFRESIDPDSAARLFVASMFGTELQHYQDPEGVPLPDTTEALFDQFQEWLCVPDIESPGGPRP